MTVSTAAAIVGKAQTAKIDHTTMLAISGTEKPLAGAVVTLVDFKNIAPRLALDPGELYTVTDINGEYSFHAAEVKLGSQGFVLQALHPKFPGLIASSAAIVASLQQKSIHAADINFEIPQGPVPDITPPAIHASHTPSRPSPGANAMLLVSVTDSTIDVVVRYRLAGTEDVRVLRFQRKGG